MSKHYDDIAQEFDDNWMFSKEYRNWYTDKIINLLDIRPKDIMIDVGCGTGIFSKKIIDNSSLKRIICVENSLSMCERAEEYEELDVIHSEAKIYFNKKNITFDKILFKEVIHHLTDRQNTFETIYQKISNNGKLLIATRPKKVEFPFFEKAHESFSVSQPDYILFKEELIAKGFNVEISLDKYKINLSKDKWNRMLRNRFMSNLSEFSDTEINNGILEISKKYSLDNYTFYDNLVFIIASK